MDRRDATRSLQAYATARARFAEDRKSALPQRPQIAEDGTLADREFFRQFLDGRFGASAQPIRQFHQSFGPWHLVTDSVMDSSIFATQSTAGKEGIKR